MPQPKDQPVDELELIKPKFLDLVENGWAGEDNPHRIGIVVRNGYRSGRMNPGKYVVLTDGKGDFWEIGNIKGHRMKVVGNLIQAECNRARIDELKKIGCCDYWEDGCELNVCRGQQLDRIAELQQLMKEGE